MAAPCGSVVHHVVTTDDDIAWRKVHSAVLYRALFSGEEADDPATGPDFAGEDVRQRFVETLHPQLIQVDLRQLGAEFSSRRGKKLNIRRANGGLIRKWIRKVENFAPRHFRTPGFPETEKLPGQQAGNATTAIFWSMISCNYFAGRGGLRDK
jgi:hypothetical protein